MVTMMMSCLLKTRSVEPDSSVIRYIVQCNIQSSEFNTEDKCQHQQKAPQSSEFNTEDKWQRQQKAPQGSEFNTEGSEFNTEDKCQHQQKAPQGSEFNTEDKWQQPYSPKLKNHDF